MEYVTPIDAALQRQVIAETEYYVKQAAAAYKRRFRYVPVLFDLSGRTAGMFKLQGRRGWIRYNPWIFSKYFDENLRNTVPHEVAHYVVYKLYGLRGIKPHGPQWQEVMELFDADQGVTFDLDLEGIPQRQQRTYPYRCDCMTHEMSATRHNRVMRGIGSYSCRVCGSDLHYAGEDHKLESQ
ncbi:MAG: SprT-like domain-containing protein [Pseudomonadota bacterium]